ncbi:MAG: OmpA family protein [Kiritimatiellaeota bacterium]|nr:OmpA family protein [Kiritimatiellota bacterium]
MKTLNVGIVLACWVACLSHAAQVTERLAAEGGGQARWYVSPGVGIMMLDGPTDNEPVFFDLSVGYDLTDYVSLEAGMMYAPAHDAEPGVKGGQSAGPTLDVLFHVLGKDGGRWDPYVTAGLAYWFANGDLFYQHDRGVLVPRVGAGLAYHLTDDLSLRLEGKTGTSTRHFCENEAWITTAELGLLYRFGGSSSSSSSSNAGGLESLPPPVPQAEFVKETTPDNANDYMMYELYINFDWDKTVIKPEYQAGLNNIVRIIKKALAENPNVTVLLEGHADQRRLPDGRTSGEAYNQRLSERRAEGVKAYLVASGIDGAKLKTVGYGFSKPKVTPDLDRGNPENRRVDLTIQGVGDAANRQRLRQL